MNCLLPVIPVSVHWSPPKKALSPRSAKATLPPLPLVTVLFNFISFITLIIGLPCHPVVKTDFQLCFQCSELSFNPWSGELRSHSYCAVWPFKKLHGENTLKSTYYYWKLVCICIGLFITFCLPSRLRVYDKLCFYKAEILKGLLTRITICESEKGVGQRKMLMQDAGPATWTIWPEYCHQLPFTWDWNDLKPLLSSTITTHTHTFLEQLASHGWEKIHWIVSVETCLRLIQPPTCSSHTFSCSTWL